LNIIEAVKDHIADLQQAKQLYPSDAQKKELEKIRAELLQRCSMNPTAFWSTYKHEVSLPYTPEFSASQIATRSKAIPMNAKEMKQCQEEIQDLLQKGMIRESTSPWACFAFYVNKHSEIVRGVPRLVVNYKPLNKALAYDSYPIPKSSVILSQVSQSKIFSKFDCKSGFWQIGIKEEDKYKTTFTVPQGHFEWNVMPFELKNAPSAFQRAMDKNFQGMETFLKVYIDDILIHSANIPEHLQHLKAFNKRCKEKGVVLSSKKMQLCEHQISFLGYVIKYGSISVMQHSIEFVDKFPDEIKETTQLQRFLGCLNYISKFYKNCAQDRKLLNQRLKKNAEPWTLQHTQAVQSIKAKVRNLKALAPINEEADKQIYTDASGEGWGAILCQTSEEGKPEICQYASGTWTDAQQKNWAAVRKELRAVCLAIEKFRDFIIFRPFTVFTDCSALKSLIAKASSQEAVIVRWLMSLAHFTFDIIHIDGSKNSFADMLSREFLNRTEELHIMEAIQREPVEEDPGTPERPDRDQYIIYLELTEHVKKEFDLRIPAQLGFPLHLLRFISNGRIRQARTNWIPFQDFRGETALVEWSYDILRQRNAEAIAALEELSERDCISYYIHFQDEGSIHLAEIEPLCRKIILKSFTQSRPHEFAEGPLPGISISQLFEQAMQLQIFEQTMWYTFQWSNYSPHNNPRPRLFYDPTPDWFLEWWKFYGSSPWHFPASVLREIYSRSAIYSRARTASISKPEAELKWWDVYQIRERTWINTLRTQHRYPTIRWIYRPRVFFRYICLDAHNIEQTQPNLDPDEDSFLYGIDVENNPFRLANNAYLQVFPSNAQFRREYQINHVTQAYHQPQFFLQQQGHELPPYSRYTESELLHWEEISLILRPDFF